MFKAILSVLLAVAFVAMLPMVGGCEDKKEIKVEKRTTVTDMPTGEQKYKVD